MNKQTQKNKEQNKQTKNSRFRNNRISVLVYVLVLLLQHLALVFIFKQRLCVSLSRCLGSLTDFFLSFSSCCIVSSSFSEMWQFEFLCCPQFPEVSSVAHQPSCFGVGFLLCWFTGGLFLYLAPFLRGKVSDPSAGPLLSVCCEGLLFVFQFCSAI
jgi:hypothetical protein